MPTIDWPPKPNNKFKIILDKTRYNPQWFNKQGDSEVKGRRKQAKDAPQCTNSVNDPLSCGLKPINFKFTASKKIQFKYGDQKYQATGGEDFYNNMIKESLINLQQVVNGCKWYLH